MFNCSNCGCPTGPKVSPNYVPGAIRPMTYTNYNSEGEVVLTGGSEFEFERQLCPPCSGGKLSVEPKADHTAQLTLALTLQGHARKCNKMLSECVQCQRNLKTFASLPLPVVQIATTEKPAKAGHVRMVEMCLIAMHNRRRDISKRANADFQTAFAVIKGYEERGGTL